MPRQADELSCEDVYEPLEELAPAVSASAVPGTVTGFGGELGRAAVAAAVAVLHLEMVSRPEATDLQPAADSPGSAPVPAVPVIETGTCTVHLPVPQTKVDKAVQTALQGAVVAPQSAVPGVTAWVQTEPAASTTRGCQTRVRMHAARTQTRPPRQVEQDCQTEPADLVDEEVQTDAVTESPAPGLDEDRAAATAADSPPATGE